MVKIGSHTNRPNTLVSAASVRWRTLAEKVYCRAQHQEAGSDWLNPFSLGAMSASAYIENVV